MLYEAAAKGLDPRVLLTEALMAPDPFTAQLVDGVARVGPELDVIIGRLAKGWTVQRMPVLDVNILRLALFELRDLPDIPVGAVISEAVELAKQYSTEESGRFVNGLLGTAAAELRA